MADVSLDYFSPFFRAAIITDPKNRSGSRWPLWSFGSEQQSQQKSQSHEANGLGALAYCTDITVKLKLSYIPVITATLSPPIDDARKLLDSPLIEYAKGAEGSSLLEVQFGYTNGPDGGALSPPFEGSLIIPPQVSFGADASITLTAQGTGGFDASRSEVSTVFTKKKRIEMMQEALKPLNITIDSSDVDPSSAEGKALDEVIEAHFPANSVAWFFVTDMAVTCGCWVSLGLDANGQPVIKLLSVNKVLGSQPTVKFRYYDFPSGQLDAKAGVFPILGISTPTTSVFMSGAATGLRTMSYDSKTREIKEGTVDDTSAAPKRSGDGAVSKTNDANKGDFHSGDTSTPEGQAKAKQAYVQAQGTQGTQIEVDTIGIPTLVPGTLISVFGVAARLNQNYIVDSVEHNVGTSGYSTKFTAYANVSPLAGGSSANRLGSAVKQPTDPNTQTANEKAPEATSSSTVTVQPKTNGGT